MSGYYIYYLIDPITQTVRYIGYSKVPYRRYRAHLRDSCDPRRTDWDSHKCCWIRSLLGADLNPVLSIRCIVQTHEEAQALEVILIAKLRQQGVPLTNGTIGGDGGSQGKAARLKMRLAKLGKKYTQRRSEESRTRSRKSAIRRFENQEERERQRQIGIQQWNDPVERAKRINFTNRGRSYPAWNKGVPCSDETRAKIRKTKLQRSIEKAEQEIAKLKSQIKSGEQ